MDECKPLVGGEEVSHEDGSAVAAADTAAAAAAAAAAGFTSADVSSALDHLAFDRLQAIMEKTEVSKGVEVMGTMRQVVVVGAGLDTRAFRIPWPRGTALFELAHRDVHQFAVGPGRYRSPRHSVPVDSVNAWQILLAMATLPVDSINEGSSCVSMTWRAMGLADIARHGKDAS